MEYKACILPLIVNGLESCDETVVCSAVAYTKSRALSVNALQLQVQWQGVSELRLDNPDAKT